MTVGGSTVIASDYRRVEIGIDGAGVRVDFDIAGRRGGFGDEE